MKKTILLAAASSMAFALGGSPAFAAGTTQGTDITNTVTVDYSVGGVNQTDVTASDTFKVDRKVNLTVSEVGGAATSVAPGQTGAVTTFLVSNTSNDVLDLGLVATQQVGGAGRHGGTDNFNVTTPTIYRESNGTAGFQTTDTVVTYLDQVAADANVTVYVVANIPVAQLTNDRATVILTATAQSGAAAGSQGADLVQSATNTNNVVDTVFADDNANANTARDGKSFDRDDYLVLAAALTVTKTSLVLSDPFNGSTNPKAIPGATVQYCIIVSNAAGGGLATGVSLTDIIPSQLTFVAGSSRINGTHTGGVCDATTGTAGGTISGQTVSATLADIAAGTARTLLFTVTIN